MARFPVGIILSGSLLTLMQVSPGDPALLIAEARYGTDLTPEQVEMIKKAEGFDQPWYVQYYRWAEHIVSLDLGRSLITGKAVTQEITDRLPATLSLATTSLALSLSISLGLGTWCALRHRTWKDRMGSPDPAQSRSLHSYWPDLDTIVLGMAGPSPIA